MPDMLRELFYQRYDPMAAASPNRPEYDVIYDELEQIEGELRRALDEEKRKKLRRFSVLEAQLRNMSFGDYFSEGFYLAIKLLCGEGKG